MIKVVRFSCSAMTRTVRFRTGRIARIAAAGLSAKDGARLDVFVGGMHHASRRRRQRVIVSAMLLGKPAGTSGERLAFADRSA
jgi:hypothetical protein